MNSVGLNNVQVVANVADTFGPQGKQAVGLENADAKEDVLAPIEEASAKSATFGREDSDTDSADTTTKGQDNNEKWLQQEQQILRELAARDREVRAHEQAHAVVGGQFAGAPHFDYQRGTNGVNYAVSGDVSISLAEGNDPEATLVAAQQVRRAALAPSNPSAQDRSVAAAADQLASQALADIALHQAQIEEQKNQKLLNDNEPQIDNIKTAARRSTQLDEQLATVENTSDKQQAGAVLDQIA